MGVKKQPTPAPTDSATEASEQIRTTGISLPGWAIDLLLDVANKRKKARADRASVSGVILSLIERHRKELEAELKG